MANVIDESISFETCKEGFEENFTEEFPSLSDFYPNNSTPKLIDQELVEDLQHGSKEQTSNEQQGFEVGHQVDGIVGGGAVLPSDQAKIYIKFPREGCSYTFEEASKLVFDRIPNSKGRKGHQFETAFVHPDDNHHMTAVNQCNVQDVMWLDDVAIEIAANKFPAYFVSPEDGAPTTDTNRFFVVVALEDGFRQEHENAWRRLTKSESFFLHLYDNLNNTEPDAFACSITSEELKLLPSSIHLQRNPVRWGLPSPDTP
ncbi:hypothetical protein CFAM422_011430 [Trichoderma lentiforme]|uniref:Uncharacterized protein n=1 Tax=Trichoderma lentiforme TaxID=1567552 RepID=A0A9P5C9A6_9HYPO|nr:hypothetical protein CFAM422_011430 [Trichoderma lentiforme]